MLSFLALLPILGTAYMYDTILTDVHMLPPSVCENGCVASWADVAASYSSVPQSTVDALFFDRSLMNTSACALPANLGVPEGASCYCAGTSAAPSKLFGTCEEPLIPQPQQINLQFGADGSSIQVAFVTIERGAPLVAPPRVELCGPALSAPCVNVSGTTTRAPEPQDPTRVYSYSFVQLPRLTPRGAYTYRAIGGTDAASWSPRVAFSAPALTPGTFPVSFAVFGDQGVYPYSSIGNLRDDVANDAIQFLVHLGDLSYNLAMDNGTRGDGYMYALEPSLSRIPWLASIGNHELEGSPFGAYCSEATYCEGRYLNQTAGNRVAGNSSSSFTNEYYSIDVGPVHFISLSGMPYLGLGRTDLRAAQNTWLARDLAKASAPSARSVVPWIIIITHVPAYCSSITLDKDAHVPSTDVTDCNVNGNGVSAAIRADWETLMISHGVDLYLAGHVHAYESLFPVGPNGSVPATSFASPRAPVHVLTGAGGPPGDPDTFVPTPYSRRTLSAWSYSRVTIHNATAFSFEQVFNNGTIFDLWSVTDATHNFTCPSLLPPSPVSRPSSLPPLLFRVSKFAAPNETVLINGVNLATATVFLCPLRGGGSCQEMEPASASWDGGIKVTVPSPPAAWGVRACTAGLCSESAQAQRFTINAPRVAWALGDGGGDGGTGQSSVAAGGVLRVFGAALAIDGVSGACPSIRADDHGAAPASVPAGTLTAVSLCSWPSGAQPCIALPRPSISSCYRLDVVVPAGTPVGAYSLIVDNALASSLDGAGALDAPLRVDVFAPEPWPATPQWIVGVDCSIVDCLAAADSAGGGVVRLPPGVSDVPRDASLNLPRHTTLVGAAVGSTLRWAANSAAGASAPAISCRGSARAANFTMLVTSPIGVGLHFVQGAGGCEADALNVTLDVSLDGPSVGAAFAADEAAGWRITNSILFQRGLCNLSWPHNTAYTIWGAHDGLFANNSVACFCQGHSTDSSQRIVFDNNTVVALGPLGSQGSGFSTFESPQVLEHIYDARRIDVGNPSSVRHYESMTFDGPGGAYTGTFLSASTDGTDGAPQTVTLAAPARVPYPGGGANISSYLGASVSVIFGPGLGSTARVAGIVPDNSSWLTARTWVFDPPLIGAVAGASFIAINPFRGGFVFEGSAYVNDTTFQLWAQATDIVIAGNAFFNIAGDVRNWPLQYQCPWKDGFPCAWQVNIDTHFLGNVLECSRGGLNAVSSDYGAVPPVDVSLGISNTRRGNILRGGSVGVTGRFVDLLVEHTVFEASSACGMDAGGVDVNASIPYVLIR